MQKLISLRDRTYKVQQLTMFDMPCCEQCKRSYSNNDQGKMFCNIYAGPKSVPKLVDRAGLCKAFEEKPCPLPTHNPSLFET